jgi:hypothetical protein
MSNPDSDDNIRAPSRRRLLSLAGRAAAATASCSMTVKGTFAASLPPPSPSNPFPRATQGEDPALALAQRAAEAFVDHRNAIDAFRGPEKAMLRWWRRYGEPTQPETQSPTNAGLPGDSDDREKGGDPRRSAEELGSPIPDPGETGKAWAARQQAAMQRFGYTQAVEALDSAADRHFEALSALQATRPITLAGLVAKARICRENPDDYELALSLMSDIGVLAGDVETG